MLWAPVIVRSMHGGTPAAVALALVGASAAAQPLYTEVTATHLPQRLAGPCMNAGAGDADGDGDLDVAVANEGQDQLYLNASGILVDVTAANLPREGGESREIRAADFDSNGDLDLIVANVLQRIVEGLVAFARAAGGAVRGEWESACARLSRPREEGREHHRERRRRSWGVRTLA